jgi:hypothetical protein
MTSSKLGEHRAGWRSRLLVAGMGLGLIIPLGVSAQGTTPLVDVPAGIPVVTDGVMQLDEWPDALVIPIQEGVSLHLKHANGSLLLALETTVTVAVNVLASMNDQIRIMHSSAALGTATYVQGDEIWNRELDFVWRCRNRTMSAAAIAQRELFLMEEGWLASITYQGTLNHVEYEIQDARSISQLMLVIIPASDPSAYFQWPSGVEQDILPGLIPATGHMDLSQWATLAVEDLE